MNPAPLKVTPIEFCATHLDGYLIARMSLDRDQCDGADSVVGRASDVSLTITDAMDRTRVLEPICAPIRRDARRVPLGTLVFRQVVPSDGKGVGGLPMNGVVRVQAEAKLVSWSDRVRKPLCAACTESFSLDIGGR